MAGEVREVMTTDPRSVAATDSVIDAARTMRDADVGVVAVLEGGGLRGLVTDRDIAVRAVAEGREPAATRAEEICSGELTTVGPGQSVDDVARLMRARNVRRLPVMEDGRLVGIVSLGDLAVERDPDSVLADISAAPPNE